VAVPALVIVQEFKNFELDPSDSTRIQFLVEYDISFVPDETAPPQSQQATINVAVEGFSKAVVRAATQNYIIGAVTALGGSITVSQIFTVADLV